MSQTVTCPCPCGHTFLPPKQPRSRHGAAEALKWTKLPEANMTLLLWWLSCQWVFERMSKDQILVRYGKTTLAPLAGRISELFALDLITQHKESKSRQRLEAAHDSPAVTYSLNIDRVCKVLNAGGRLKPAGYAVA